MITHISDREREKDAQIAALRAEVVALTEERDAAFAMTHCECGADEACANIVQARKEIESLRAENARLRAEIAAIKTPHIYAGSCPDDLDHNARDPKCAACRAMMKLESKP